MDVILYSEMKFHSVHQNVVMVSEEPFTIMITQEEFKKFGDDETPTKRFKQVVIDKEREGITAMEVRQ